MKKHSAIHFRRSRRINYQQEPVNTDEPQITVRHQRFDGFDVYTVKLPDSKEKLLFHREGDKTFVIGDTFRFLGSKDNMWLCEDIHTGKIHIAPYSRFTQLDKKVEQVEVTQYEEPKIEG